MASIDTHSGGGGGRRAVDAEIPLVPFIDLLLCCVMFLLVTAVWNKLAAVEATTADTASETAQNETPPPPRPYLELTRAGLSVVSPEGVRRAIEDDELAEVLSVVPESEVLSLLPDDDVAHQGVIDTLDALRASGHPRVRLLVNRPL